MMNLTKLVPALAVSALMAAPVAAQSTEQISVRNQSGVTLYSLHASATDNPSWENDLLGSRVLNNGQTFDLTVRNVSNCMYDFRMEFTNGQVMTDVVNICSVGTYTINR